MIRYPNKANTRFGHLLRTVCVYKCGQSVIECSAVVGYSGSFIVIIGK